jgi:hypothetical protein
MAGARGREVDERIASLERRIDGPAERERQSARERGEWQRKEERKRVGIDEVKRLCIRTCFLITARERLALASLLAPLMLCNRWNGTHDEHLLACVANCISKLAWLHAAHSPLAVDYAARALRAIGASRDLSHAAGSRLAVQSETGFFVVPTQTVLGIVGSVKFSENSEAIAKRSDSLDGAPAVLLQYRRNFAAAKEAMLRARALAPETPSWLGILGALEDILQALLARFGDDASVSGSFEDEAPTTNGVLERHRQAWTELLVELRNDQHCALYAQLLNGSVSGERVNDRTQLDSDIPRVAIEDLVQATAMEMRLLTASLLSWVPLIDASLTPLVVFATSALCHHDLPQLSLNFASALLLFVMDMGFHHAAAIELRRLAPRRDNMADDVRTRLGSILRHTPYFEEEFRRRSGLSSTSTELQAQDMQGLMRIYGVGIAPEYSGGLSRSVLTDTVEKAIGVERKGRRLVDHVRDNIRKSPQIKTRLESILQTKTPRVSDVWKDDNDWLVEILRNGLGEENRRAVDYERSLLKQPQQIAAHVIAIGERLRIHVDGHSPNIQTLYGPEVSSTKYILKLFKLETTSHVEMALRALANLNRGLR